MRSTIAGFYVIALLGVLAPKSEAIVYELQTNAIIRSISFGPSGLSDDNQAFLDSLGIGIGQSITSTYVLDGDAQGTVVTDMGVESTVYDALLASSVAFVNVSIALVDTGVNDFIVQNDANLPFGERDRVGVSASEVFDPAAGQLRSMFVSSQLYSSSAQAISDTQLDPSDFIDLSVWDSFDDGMRTGLFVGMTLENGDRVNLSAEYTFNTVRVVPLPGAGLLLVGALAGLVGVRRRSQLSTDH